MRGRSSPLERLATGVLEIEAGFKVRGTELWLDPPRRKPLAYVSHAHADHMLTGHRKAFVSLKTARFYQKRFKGNELVGLKYGEKCRAGKAVIELFPAGHILGSSQVLLEVEGMRVVYTGDIKVSASFTAERIKMEPCDVLIMECTYGEPKYLFPQRDEMAAELLSFVKDCFGRGITPVILAYSVGKAQEAVKVLGDAGVTARLEKSVYEATEIYAELGVELINYRSFPPFTPAKEVIVIPPWRADLIRSIPRKRTLFLTGWALDRRKMGFGLPIRNWFRDELSGYLAEKLESKALESLGVLKPGATKTLLEEHQAGARNHQHRLWALMNLAVWAETFLV